WRAACTPGRSGGAGRTSFTSASRQVYSNPAGLRGGVGGGASAPVLPAGKYPQGKRGHVGRNRATLSTPGPPAAASAPGRQPRSGRRQFGVGRRLVTEDQGNVARIVPRASFDDVRKQHEELPCSGAIAPFCR